MDTVLFVLVSLLVGGFALGFYMDWFGLWVSKEERREQIERAKERKHRLEKQIGNKIPETGVNPRAEAGTEANPAPGSERAGMTLHPRMTVHDEDVPPEPTEAKVTKPGTGHRSKLVRPEVMAGLGGSGNAG